MLKEIKSRPFLYALLLFVLLFGFMARVWGLGGTLGFYFDQGRDALVIWDLWHKGKFFLIGPTTGLTGIFRGPYYYYLIAPFYLLGRGNPVWPSVFLSFTTVIACLLGFVIGFKLQNRITGLITAILTSFSFYIVTSSRWLSNPTPMLLTSMLLILAMVEIVNNERKIANKWWVVIGLVSGLSIFNFGSSGELFYLPAILIFAIWQRNKLPDLKWIAISLFAFFLTFAPLLFFDLKHDHILINNFIGSFGQEKSFALPTKYQFILRNNAYLALFPRLLFHSIGKLEKVLLGGVGAAFLIFLFGFLKDDKAKVVLLLFASPLIGFYFYQGNYNQLYEYYLTGYFLIFLLIVSLVLGEIWKRKMGKIFVAFFIFVFLKNNFSPINYAILKNTGLGEGSVSFASQKQSIDWIYKSAGEKKFNVDTYVPPVIPYAYDYLFLWLGSSKYGYIPEEHQISLLYTLYEDDPPHPERLDAWLKRQEGIGEILEEHRFGGITVQRRTRLQ